MIFNIAIAYEEGFVMEVESDTLASAKEKALELVDMEAAVTIMERRLKTLHREYCITDAVEVSV